MAAQPTEPKPWVQAHQVVERELQYGDRVTKVNGCMYMVKGKWYRYPANLTPDPEEAEMKQIDEEDAPWNQVPDCVITGVIPAEQEEPKDMPIKKEPADKGKKDDRHWWTKKQDDKKHPPPVILFPN